MSINNDGKHLQRIVAETVCTKHHSNKNVPCWAMEGGKPGNYVLGVCGSRIRAVGYNGKITSLSTQLKPSTLKKRSFSPSR